MKIYLIRHGEKEGHGFESKLTKKGKKQIVELAQRCKSALPKNIYSSSNPRSIESCEIISKEIGVSFGIVNDIKEIQRETFFSLEEHLDSEEAVNLENIKKFLKKIILANKDVLLVMNAGINRFIMCYLFNYPLSKAYMFTQDFGSLSEIELKEIHGKNRWCLNSINLSRLNY